MPDLALAKAIEVERIVRQEHKAKWDARRELLRLELLDREIQAEIRKLRAFLSQELEGPGTNSGHGHVWDRPDGTKARCGGPAMCDVCRADKEKWGDQ